MRLLPCACLLLLLVACTRGPRCPVVEHARALRWDAIYEGRVHKVWDGLHASRDPKVTHLVELTVTGGDDDLVGQRLAFPYDAWSTGKPPPSSGTTVVFSPQQWVQVDPRSRGVPSRGF